MRTPEKLSTSRTSRTSLPTTTSRTSPSPYRAREFDPRTYPTQALYLPNNIRSRHSNVSTPAQSELRPSDSVSQLDTKTAISVAPYHPPDISRTDPKGSAGTGSSSFSMASSFSGTHLPDLPLLPSITPSPDVASSNHLEVARHSLTLSSRLGAPLPPINFPSNEDPNVEDEGIRNGAALLRRALEIERSEIDHRGARGAVTDVGVATLRMSWRDRVDFEGGFDPAAQRVLSAAEYHQLVDRM